MKGRYSAGLSVHNVHVHVGAVIVLYRGVGRTCASEAYSNVPLNKTSVQHTCTFITQFSCLPNSQTFVSEASSR